MFYIVLYGFSSYIIYILISLSVIPQLLSSFPNTPPAFPTYFSNTLSQTPYPTVSTTTRKFQHTFLIYVGNSNIKPIFPTHFSNILFTKEEGALSHLFPFAYLFYLLIPATFCCTHSPTFRRKCSCIFIPLMVNCLMKSYAFSSFALKVRFSAFSS